MKIYFLFFLNFILIVSQVIKPKELNSYEYSHFNLNENNQYIIYSFENKYSNVDLVFNIYKIESQTIPEFYIYTNITQIERNEQKEFINYTIKDEINKKEYEYIINKWPSLISNNYFYIVLNIKKDKFKGDIIIFYENVTTIINNNTKNICRRYKSVYSNNYLFFRTEKLNVDKQLNISFVNQLDSTLTTTFTLKKGTETISTKSENKYFGEFKLEKNIFYSIIFQHNIDKGNEIDFNLCIDINNNEFEEIKNDDKNIMKGFINQTSTFYFYHNIYNLSINSYASFIFSFEYYSKIEFSHKCSVNCFKNVLMTEKLNCDFIQDPKKIYYYLVYQKKENLTNIYFTIKCEQDKDISNLNRFSIKKEKPPYEIIDDYKTNVTNPYVPIYFLLNLTRFKNNNYQLLLLSNIEKSISIYDGNIQTHNITKIEKFSHSFIVINPNDIKQYYSSSSFFTIELYSQNFENLYLELKFMKTNYQKLYYNSFDYRKKIRYPIYFNFCYYETFLINRYERNIYNNYLYNETTEDGNFSVLYNENLNNILSIDDILQGKNFSVLNKIVNLTSNIDIIKISCNSITDIQNHLDLFFFSNQKEDNNPLKALSFNRYYIEENKFLVLDFDEKILNKEFELEISVLNSKIDNFQKMKIEYDSKEYYLDKNISFIHLNHKNKFNKYLTIKALEGNVLISILISDVDKIFQIQKHGLNNTLNPNNYYLFIYKKDEMKETKSCFLNIYSDSNTTTAFYIYKGFKKYPFIPFPSEDCTYKKIQIDYFNPFEINLLKSNNYYNDYSDEDYFISLYSINGTFHYDFLFEKDFGLIKEKLTYEINYEGISHYKIQNEYSNTNFFYFIYTCKIPFTISFYDDKEISIKNISINNYFSFSKIDIDKYIFAKFKNSHGIFQYFKIDNSYNFTLDVNLTISYKFIDDKNIELSFSNLFINEYIDYNILIFNDSSFDLKNICLFKLPNNYSYENHSFIINSNNKTIIKQINFNTEIYKNINPYITIFAKEKEHYQIMILYDLNRIYYTKEEKTKYLVFLFIILLIIVFLIIFIYQLIYKYENNGTKNNSIKYIEDNIENAQNGNDEPIPNGNENYYLIK